MAYTTNQRGPGVIDAEPPEPLPKWTHPQDLALSASFSKPQAPIADAKVTVVITIVYIMVWFAAFEPHVSFSAKAQQTILGQLPGSI